jgi:hypothetical protein
MLYARTFFNRAMPQRGARPMPPMVPSLFVARNGEEKQVAMLDYDQIHIRDYLNKKYLPTEAMQTTDYAASVEGTPTTTVKTAAALKNVSTAEEMSALEVADHVKGRVLSRLPLEGTDNTTADLATSALYVKPRNVDMGPFGWYHARELWWHEALGAGQDIRLKDTTNTTLIAVLSSEPEAGAKVNPTAAMVYAEAVGDSYELRVLFPDGTRRKISTAEIIDAPTPTPTATPTPEPTATPEPEATPTPTNYTTGGTVTANSEWTAMGFVATNLVDGNLQTRWMTEEGAFPAWIKYVWDTGKNVVGYSLASGPDIPGRDPKDWTFEGSNDGTNWTVLDTQTNNSFTERLQVKEFFFSNDNYYKMYRWNGITNHDWNAVCLTEIQFFVGNQATPTPTPTP